MSSFVHRVAKPRAQGRLPRWLCILGMPVLAATFSAQAYAACQYQIDSEWDDGFTATIKITNTTTSPVSGWDVSWQYAGDNRVSNGWNATLSGTNPYSATNFNWNGDIAPNQTVEFGFQGTKGGSAAEVPQVTGSVCGADTPTTPVSSSAASSSVPSNPSAGGLWDLDASNSFINFVSIKQHNVVEAHYFATMSGTINADNQAEIVIDLDSVNTNSNTRNNRVREFLFETATYPTATITVDVPDALLTGLAVGATTETTLTANVNLHGVTAEVSGEVSVQRLTSDRVLVQTIQPILTSVSTFGMTEGLDEIRGLARLDVISDAVPVDFSFVFEAR